jgi:hypothetical protein
MFALAAEMFPPASITRNQVELMQMDNVVSPDAPGFANLQMSSRLLEGAMLQLAFAHKAIEGLGAAAGHGHGA